MSKVVRPSGALLALLHEAEVDDADVASYLAAALTDRESSDEDAVELLRQFIPSLAAAEDDVVQKSVPKFRAAAAASSVGTSKASRAAARASAVAAPARTGRTEEVKLSGSEDGSAGARRRAPAASSPPAVTSSTSSSAPRASSSSPSSSSNPSSSASPSAPSATSTAAPSVPILATLESLGPKSSVLDEFESSRLRSLRELVPDAPASFLTELLHRHLGDVDEAAMALLEGDWRVMQAAWEAEEAARREREEERREEEREEADRVLRRTLKYSERPDDRHARHAVKNVAMVHVAGGMGRSSGPGLSVVELASARGLKKKKSSSLAFPRFLDGRVVFDK